VNGATLVFYGAAVVALASAFAVIWSRSPVYSVIFLVANFFATSVLFLLLGAEFLAAVQILVYAGAILVLFLFVVMLLNLRRVERWRTSLVSLMGYVLAAGIGFELVWQLARRVGREETDAGAPLVGTVQVIGQLLYTKYLFLFEATSVLLFVAVIGAVVLAKQVGGDAPVGRRLRSPLAGAEPLVPRAVRDGATGAPQETPAAARERAS
jgi:NADH-quinone oxidoreductase subunit J